MKFKLCQYEFMPNNKMTGKIIRENRRKLEMSPVYMAMNTKLYVMDSTVNSWEEGHNMPNMDSRVELANLFHISLDELLRPKAAFQNGCVPDTEYLTWDLFDYLWYLLEKSTFSFLSMMEDKTMYLDGGRYCRVDGEKKNMWEFLEEWNAFCKEKYGKKYKTDAGSKQREEIFYTLRKKVYVYRSNGQPIYLDILNGNPKCSNRISSLPDYDKMIVATAANLLWQNGAPVRNLLLQLSAENAAVFSMPYCSVSSYDEALYAVCSELQTCEYADFRKRLQPISLR